MNPHPLSELLPKLEDEALRELADDIREHGLREPIMTLDGLVLDGRNRLRACELAGVEPRFEAFRGDDPLGYVASMNLYRRHLNESQRALVAARVINIYEVAARESRNDAQTANWRSANDAPPIGGDAGPPIGGHHETPPPIGGPRTPTARQLADLTNVGLRSVERAKQVVRTAIPEVVAAVQRGTLALSAAEKLAALPPDEQRRELANPSPRRSPAPPPSSVVQLRPDEDLQLAADVETAFERARALADAALIRPRARGMIELAIHDLEAWLRRVRRAGSAA